MRNGGQTRRWRGLAMAAMALLGAMLVGCQPSAPPPPTTMPTPGAVSASDGAFGDRVAISWSDVSGATRYEIQRSIHSDGPFEALTSTANILHNDTDVTPGGVYWYRVRACAGDCSPWSTPVSGFASTPSGQPWAPQEVAATQGDHDDKIVITWLALPGAVHYAVYRASSIEGPFGEIATPPGNTYVDVDVEGNRLTECHGYWYRVSGCRTGGCLAMSLSVEGWRHERVDDEAAVRELTATDRQHPDRVHLSWQAFPGALEYVVYRDTQENEIGRSSAPSFDDVFDAADNPIEADRLYSYWVRACGEGACGCSALSPRVEGRASSLPGAPVNVQAASQTGKVTLSWEKGASIVQPTQYRIERAEGNQAFATIGEVAHTVLSYEDTTVEAGVNYRFRVVARNATGDSSPSEEVRVTAP